MTKGKRPYEADVKGKSLYNNDASEHYGCIDSISNHAIYTSPRVLFKDTLVK